MKKNLLFVALLFACFFLSAQKTDVIKVANLERYAESNEDLLSLGIKKHAVVFIGNSITEGWAKTRPEFFSSNNYIGRGIGGQTSPQMLLRFRQDVVSLEPEVVVINAGTNDIAENTGKYSLSFTLGNIKSMVEIAQANDIKVILTSVLPAGEFRWNQDITDAPQKIDTLNKEIKSYAKKKGIPYVDYNIKMRKEDGSMKNGLSGDGVHPTEEGYQIMEQQVKSVIDKILKKK